MPIGNSNPLIFQGTLPELAPSRRFGGCRGIVGPVPPPLWIRVSDYSIGSARRMITPMPTRVNNVFGGGGLLQIFGVYLTSGPSPPSGEGSQVGLEVTLQRLERDIG